MNRGFPHPNPLPEGEGTGRHLHPERNERLRQQGFTDDDLARIHSPIGLDLGAVTPEEIGLSIVAEMVATRYGRDGRKLSEKLRAAEAAEGARS